MKTIFFTAAVIMTFLFFTWAAVRIVKEIQFEVNCAGHMKRAADANTVELAIKEMEIVVDFLNKNSLNTGYTSIFYRTPDEDIGFWYTNLNQSLNELKVLSKNSTPLEKSNMLMKLRETLLDQGESINVTYPEGISIYPYNVTYCLWCWISFILASFCFWYRV